MADKREATHSLRTEIQMLFNTQGVDKIEDDIFSISDGVYEMVEPVRELTKAFEDLNKSPLNDLVKTLENFSLDSVEVDARNLRKVLENKIASAISKSTIEFIGDEGTERYPFKIKMGEDFWEKNQKNVAEAMARSFSNFEVDTSKVPPLDNTEILKEFQTKFNEQIVELIKDEEIFSLYRKDPKKDIKKFKYKRKFNIDEKAVDEIMGAVEAEFLKVLSDPSNIEIEDMPKLKIKSTELKQAMLKIQESIGDIDSLIGVDADVLKDLPDIEDKLIHFRNNMEKMIKDINLLAEQLDSITIGKATESDIQQALQSINSLKDNVTIHLNEWVVDVAKVLNSQLQMRPNLDQFKESITNLNTYFEVVFQKQLETFEKDVEIIMANLTQKDGGAKKDVFEGKKIDITQTILDAITDNLLNEDIPIELDMGMVEVTLLEWAREFNIAINEDLVGLTDTILDDMSDVFETIAIRVDQIVTGLITDLNELFDIDDSIAPISSDLQNSVNTLYQDMYEYIMSSITSTTIKDLDVSEAEFELPKSFRRDIKQIVDRNIREYSRAIVDNYKVSEVEIVEIDKVVEKLNKHTTMIVNAVIRESNQILTDLRKSFLHQDNGWVESTENLKDTFNKNVRLMTEAYINALENAINTILITGESLEYLQEQIADEIVSKITVKDIQSDPVILNLDEEYTVLANKIGDEIKNLVKQWVPNIPDLKFEEVFNSDSINNAIEQQINNTVDKYISIIESEEMSTELVGENLVKSTQDIIDEVISKIEEIVRVEILDILTSLSDNKTGGGEPDVDTEILTKKIDKLIEDAIYMRIDQVIVSNTIEDKINIDLDKSIKKALNQMKVTIDTIIDSSIDKIGENELGEVKLKIKTKRLQNNVNSMIQKMINESSKQITVYGNQLAKEIDISAEMLVGLKQSLDNLLDNTIAGYTIAAEALSSKMYSNEEINTIYSRLFNGFTEAFSVVVDSFVDNLIVASQGEFVMKTSQLHPKIKKSIADQLGVSVREFTKSFPEIRGSDAQDVVIKKNVELITNAVNDVITSSIRHTVTSYQKSIKDVEIQPDSSLVEYIYDRLIELQDTVVARAKKMVRDQFKYLTEEIKQMNIDAKSMGYRPTKAFAREVEKATGTDVIGSTQVRIENATMNGSEVVAQGLKITGTDVHIPNIGDLTTHAGNVIIDGKVVDLKVDSFPVDRIVAPIENLLNNQQIFNPLTTEHISDILSPLSANNLIPQNVYNRGYKPFDINNILFEKEVEPYKGLFEGITANMAKYFMVGYMMRLPIKAVTEANKIASELDYHLAKARQNILIKDPQMTTTAQRIVYDWYKTEGQDVGSKKFREDVNKEAANLRSIMNTEMSDYLLNISKAYYQEIADVGRYYSIASRRSRDPYEALTKTREISKIAAVEEDLDTDFAASGMEAMAAQWSVDISELDRYTNMMLKTAMLSNTTVTDLMMAQRDTAAMFKSRLAGLEDEEAFATAMALSSMFVEATGKSGRESGTFWRNVLQRPYVKDSRKFLEQASQMQGFEDLDPYYMDETGKRVQKDFLTMFSSILETAVKVDDPSAMTVLSEVFPIRTIGGAESVSALVEDLKIDLEKSIQILKDMGELDEDATIDTVDVKEVIEKYIENIMEVTEEDIGMYLAGLQDTTQFAVKGLQTQWQTTVYNIFKEMKEETSAAMTYFTAILRKFEENSNLMSEVIGIFMKLGVGYLGKDMVNRIIQKGEEAPIVPTGIQREMVAKYTELQGMEKSLDLKKKAVERGLEYYESRMFIINNDVTRLQDERHQLHTFIQDLEGRKELTYDEQYQLDKAQRQRDMYDDQLIKLRNTYKELDREVYGLKGRHADIERDYEGTISLGKFLKNSMGARSVDELGESFANYIRNEYLYNEIAPIAIRSTLTHDDEWYSQLHERKKEIEDSLLTQQKELLGKINESYRYTSPEELEKILGVGYGDEFYALEHRVSEDTIETMKNLFDTFGVEYSDMRKNFEKTHKELNNINSELIGLNVDRLEVERAIFEAEKDKLVGHTVIEGMEMPLLEPKTYIEKIEDYRSLLPAFGVNVDDFESGMDKLASMFKDGKFDVDDYESSLKEISTQLGIADRDFDKFKLTIRELNNEIKKGKKDIYEYIAALEAASTKSGRLVRPTPERGEDEKTSSLDNTGKAALGVGALSLAGGEVGKVGLWSKLAAKFGATKLGIGLSKVGAKVGATKLGALGKGLGIGVKGIFTKLPKVALMYAGVSAIGSVMGGLTERSMTDAERLSMEADKLERHINKATGWKIDAGDSGIKRLGKWAATGAGGVFSGLMNQINRLVGGTAPSFKDTVGMRYEAMKHPELTRDELRTQMKEEYDVEIKRARANYERQQELLNKNPFVDPITGELRKPGDPYLQNIPFEDLMEFLDRRMKDLNKVMMENDALFTKEKVRLLISGISNNSKEMRDAIKEHLNRNIDEMTRIVDELKEYLPTLVPGTEAHAGMQLQILDLENRIAESELQKFETDFSEFDEIMERYSRQSSLLQSRWDIKKYDAILAGISKDSSAIRQIEKKMADEQVKLMTSIQNRLEGLRQQYADKPEQRDKILIQIQQLEADKKKILADIKDKMSEGLSTFNLPSDIKPITYYEAMTRNNTHRNMTVRAGDAIVNVNIDNMSGSDADVDRLGKAVSSAVAQAQKNFVRQFANDVKSGMGNNYYSWNNY